MNELAREGNDVVRWNRLHPGETEKVPYLTQQLSGKKGPFVAATDYQKAHTDQLREFVPGPSSCWAQMDSDGATPGSNCGSTLR